jgi:hypothetical protein
MDDFVSAEESLPRTQLFSDLDIILFELDADDAHHRGFVGANPHNGALSRSSLLLARRRASVLSTARTPKGRPALLLNRLGKGETRSPGFRRSSRCVDRNFPATAIRASTRRGC